MTYFGSSAVRVSSGAGCEEHTAESHEQKHKSDEHKYCVVTLAGDVVHVTVPSNSVRQNQQQLNACVGKYLPRRALAAVVAASAGAPKAAQARGLAPLHIRMDAGHRLGLGAILSLLPRQRAGGPAFSPQRYTSGILYTRDL